MLKASCTELTINMYPGEPLFLTVNTAVVHMDGKKSTAPHLARCVTIVVREITLLLCVYNANMLVIEIILLYPMCVLFLIHFMILSVLIRMHKVTYTSIQFPDHNISPRFLPKWYYLIQKSPCRLILVHLAMSYPPSMSLLGQKSHNPSSLLLSTA